MRTRSLLSFLAAVTLVPATIAWTGARHTLTLLPESKLWIEGSSTVRGFECQATSLTVQVDAATRGAIAAVLGGDKAVTNVNVVIPAAKLDCQNGTMNSHMWKALRANDHPEIVFRLTTYELATATEGVQVILTGELDLGGTTKSVAVVANAAPVDGNAIRVTGVHDIRLSEFDLKAPKLMLGAMKVHDLVRVHFDLRLAE